MGLIDFDIGSLGKSIMDGIDELVTSDDERAAAKLKVQALLAQPMLMQAEANIQSAKSTNWWVAGARPALMWVCALALLWNWLLLGIVEVFIATFSDNANQIMSLLPTIDSHEVTGLITALLGLGALRTWEKTKGVARD